MSVSSKGRVNLTGDPGASDRGFPNDVLAGAAPARRISTMIILSVVLPSQAGALFAIAYIWSRKEALGLAAGVRAPSWKEVKDFVGAGGAMIFRQVTKEYSRSFKTIAFDFYAPRSSGVLV